MSLVNTYSLKKDIIITLCSDNYVRVLNNDNKHMEPIYLLINNMIDYLLPSEIVFVDLGVSGRNDSLLFFKRGFGGKKYESIQYETSPNFGELKKKLVRNFGHINQML